MNLSTNQNSEIRLFKFSSLSSSSHICKSYHHQSILTHRNHNPKTNLIHMPTVEPVAATSTPVKPAAKEPKPKKAKSAPAKKSTLDHPPYFEMITDAIVTLKERSGSSVQAISKFIVEKYKNLPANYKKLLSVQLKKNVADGKLFKIKASYKLAANSSAPAKKPATAKKAPAKKKTVATPTKPKAKAKAKAPAAKPKTAAPKVKPAAKAKPAVKPKAGAKSKAAKSARTSTRSTPSKPVAALKASMKKAPAKKTASVKKAGTPKKAAAKKGKK